MFDWGTDSDGQRVLSGLRAPRAKGGYARDGRGQECPRVLVRDVREENRTVRKGPAARITVNHARLSRACVMKILHEADIDEKAHIDRASANEGAMRMQPA